MATEDVNAETVSLLPAIQYAPMGWTACPSTCRCPASNVAVITSSTDFGRHCLMSQSAVEGEVLPCLWPRYRLDWFAGPL